MASIQVSFETVREIWNCIIYAREIVWTKNPEYKITWKGKLMITFEQVTKIEVLRRQIEQLQSYLSDRARIASFGWRMSGEKFFPLDQEALPVIREAYCKFTVAKIIKLLDDSERLGVDVSASKQTLLEFLEEIKPKEEVTP